MTDRQLQIEFERRLLLMDPTLASSTKLSSDTIFAFLNEAIDKFWKTRYSGVNYKSEGFEQSLKRIDDLRTLVRTKTYNSTDISGNQDKYTVILPEDYVVLLGDKAGIQPTDNYEDPCWEKERNGDYVIKYGDTIESSIETLDRLIGNSLSEHKLKYCKARPLRLIQDKNIILYTDGKYKVSTYTIHYLKKPSLLSTSTLNNREYTDLPEHTHMEIVKMAVLLYLATKPMKNYSEYSSEVNTME